MPSAPKIGAILLSALNDKIIPLLQAQAITQVLAAPPFDFSEVEHWPQQQALLPDTAVTSLELLLRQDEAKFRSRRMALVAMRYQGASEEIVGVTHQMAGALESRGLPAPPGITAFKLVAPACLYVPPGVPHGGTSLPAAEYGASRMLLAWFATNEIWIAHHDAAAGGTHHLSIVNPELNRMEQRYRRALERRDFWTAQRFLLGLMSQLRDHLRERPFVVSNSAWPSLKNSLRPEARQISPHVARHCYKAIDYIQFHLHAPLSLETVAAVCGVTVPYLSKVFRQTTGMTVMTYVTGRRVRAAELMLRDTSERIGDIAELTGFANTQSFAGVFKRYHGITASEYRRRADRPWSPLSRSSQVVRGKTAKK